MFELMLDTANLAEIEAGLRLWPVAGVTTNPSILKKEGKVNLYEHLRIIGELCGKERSLHVQTVSENADGIIREAHAILDKLGNDTYIKIPVSSEGLPAIKTLAAEGIKVTATAIYSTMQGILAVLAGAKYIAVYFNRMENNCSDPVSAIREIRDFIDGSGSDAKIVAASFKNIAQVTAAFAAGAHSATVGVDIIQNALSMASIDAAVLAFKKDFESVYGPGSSMLTV